MNPPPLPPPRNQKSFPQQIALASLLAPLLAVLVSVVARAASQGEEPLRAVKLLSGGVGVLLVLTGLVLAIVALCCVSRHGSRGILGRGLAGLAINGLLVLALGSGFARGFASGVGRVAKSRQAVRDVQSASDDVQKSLRESYDPEKGITNIDSHRLDRLTSELEGASEKLSGDDALVMQAIASYLAGLQKQMKLYESAVTAFTDAGVLDLATLTEKAQIEPRREIIRRLLVANAALKTAIMESETTVRTNLVALRIPPAKIEKVVKSFNSKAVPRRALVAQIRDCDAKLGDGALGALDLLEAQWGQWTYEAAANEIKFTDDQHQETYEAFINQINAAGEQQVKLQGQLVKMQ